MKKHFFLFCFLKIVFCKSPTTTKDDIPGALSAIDKWLSLNAQSGDAKNIPTIDGTQVTSGKGAAFDMTSAVSTIDNWMKDNDSVAQKKLTRSNTPYQAEERFMGLRGGAKVKTHVEQLSGLAAVDEELQSAMEKSKRDSQELSQKQWKARESLGNSFDTWLNRQWAEKVTNSGVIGKQENHKAQAEQMLSIMQANEEVASRLMSTIPTKLLPFGAGTTTVAPKTVVRDPLSVAMFPDSEDFDYDKKEALNKTDNRKEDLMKKEDNETEKKFASSTNWPASLKRFVARAFKACNSQTHKRFWVSKSETERTQMTTSLSFNDDDLNNFSCDSDSSDSWQKIPNFQEDASRDNDVTLSRSSSSLSLCLSDSSSVEVENRDESSGTDKSATLMDALSHLLDVSDDSSEVSVQSDAKNNDAVDPLSLLKGLISSENETSDSQVADGSDDAEKENLGRHSRRGVRRTKKRDRKEKRKSKRKEKRSQRGVLAFVTSFLSVLCNYFMQGKEDDSTIGNDVDDRRKVPLHPRKSTKIKKKIGEKRKSSNDPDTGAEGDGETNGDTDATDCDSDKEAEGERNDHNARFLLSAAIVFMCVLNVLLLSLTPVDVSPVPNGRRDLIQLEKVITVKDVSGKKYGDNDRAIRVRKRPKSPMRVHRREGRTYAVTSIASQKAKASSKKYSSTVAPPLKLRDIFLTSAVPVFNADRQARLHESKSQRTSASSQGALTIIPGRGVKSYDGYFPFKASNKEISQGIICNHPNTFSVSHLKSDLKKGSYFDFMCNYESQKKSSSNLFHGSDGSRGNVMEEKRGKKKKFRNIWEKLKRRALETNEVMDTILRSLQKKDREIWHHDILNRIESTRAISIRTKKDLQASMYPNYIVASPLRATKTTSTDISEHFASKPFQGLSLHLNAAQKRSQLDCPSGSYNTTQSESISDKQTEDSICRSCDIGKYSENTSTTSLKSLQSGVFQIVDERSSAMHLNNSKSLPSGTLTQSDKKCYPNTCPSGTFVIMEEKKHENKIPSGRYSIEFLSSQEECLSGSYTIPQDEACPTGVFLAQKKNENKIPSGRYTIKFFSSREECPFGSYTVPEDESIPTEVVLARGRFRVLGSGRYILKEEGKANYQFCPFEIDTVDNEACENGIEGENHFGTNGNFPMNFPVKESLSEEKDSFSCVNCSIGEYSTPFCTNCNLGKYSTPFCKNCNFSEYMFSKKCESQKGKSNGKLALTTLQKLRSGIYKRSDVRSGSRRNKNKKDERSDSSSELLAVVPEVERFLNGSYLASGKFCPVVWYSSRKNKTMKDGKISSTPSAHFYSRSGNEEFKVSHDTTSFVSKFPPNGIFSNVKSILNKIATDTFVKIKEGLSDDEQLLRPKNNTSIDESDESVCPLRNGKKHTTALVAVDTIDWAIDNFRKTFQQVTMLTGQRKEGEKKVLSQTEPEFTPFVGSLPQSSYMKTMLHSKPLDHYYGVRPEKSHQLLLAQGESDLKKECLDWKSSSFYDSPDTHNRPKGNVDKSSATGTAVELASEFLGSVVSNLHPTSSYDSGQLVFPNSASCPKPKIRRERVCENSIGRAMPIIAHYPSSAGSSGRSDNSCKGCVLGSYTIGRESCKGCFLGSYTVDRETS
eukprot:g4849.t1